MHSKKTKFTDANAKGVITKQAQDAKVLHLLPIFTHPWYNLIEKPIQHRLGMSNFGNGIAVAIETLQDELDLVDVLRRATPEVARSGRVVDIRMRRHGSQAQGGAC
jgi:hypothetical protein